MRLITNNELVNVSGGEGGSFGFGWVTVYQSDDSNVDDQTVDIDTDKEIRLTTVEECKTSYPLPAGKEWQVTCKTDVTVDGYHVYNPNWKGN